MHFYRSRRRVRLPVVQRDVRPAHPRGDGLRVPGRDLRPSARCPRRRAGGAAGRPGRPRVARPTHRGGVRAGRGRGCARRAGAGREVHLGGDRRAHARGLPRGPRGAGRGGRREDPGHRRGGLHRVPHLRPAGRARPRGRRARRPHRAGAPRRQADLPHAGRGAVRRRRPQPRPARQPPAPRRRRLPLRGLPGLPARLRPVHRRQRHLHRPDLRDHRGRAARPAAASSWRRRSRRWGRASTAAAEHGEQTPDMRPEAALRARRVGDPAARTAAASWRCCGPPSASRTRRTPTGCPSTARSRWRSTSAAATASRPWRCATASCRARASRSTTPTPAPAGSSACTTCSAGRRPSTRTAARSATTSTSTTSSTPTCWC